MSWMPELSAMDAVQPGVLPPVPEVCRYLTFGLSCGRDPTEALERLRDLGIGEEMVVGLGASLIHLLGQEVDGLRALPPVVGPGVDIPSTPSALWLWLRGSDRGDMVARSNALTRLLGPAFRLDEVVARLREAVIGEEGE